MLCNRSLAMKPYICLIAAAITTCQGNPIQENQCSNHGYWTSKIRSYGVEIVEAKCFDACSRSCSWQVGDPGFFGEGWTTVSEPGCYEACRSKVCSSKCEAVIGTCRSVPSSMNICLEGCVGAMYGRPANGVTCPFTYHKGKPL